MRAFVSHLPATDELQSLNSIPARANCTKDFTRRGVPGLRGKSLAIALIALVLIASGCRQRSSVGSLPTPPPPPSPPPPNFLALGDAAYAARDSAVAVGNYQKFLVAGTLSSERDRVLFRVGLLHLLPASPLHDIAQAKTTLQLLMEAYPTSDYSVQARLYLDLYQEVEQQTSSIAEYRHRIEELGAEMTRLKADDAMKAEDLQKLKAEAARREERIRQITTDLDRLKEIDMLRRPAVPRR
ncbi:MAG: hypothetical protein EXQ56_06685 [Acidobacteria bacterium]|nr:hypothetical protein [Acidobacteriota bacterium]